MESTNRFTVEILADEAIYELSFRTKQMVLEKIDQAYENHDRVLYHRKHGQGIRFHASYHDNDALKYASQEHGTTVVLTNSVFQKIDMFNLCTTGSSPSLIAPKSQFLHLAGVVRRGTQFGR